MTSARLETFSDGVIAILITIMVLSLRTPSSGSWKSFQADVPPLFVYALSFAFLGIYWNNHHHLFTAVEAVSGGVLWANLHLLFWLSLIPFVTRWMAVWPPKPLPVAAYGFVGLMAAVAYYALLRVILAVQGRDSALAAAVGRDYKGKLSAVAYLLAIPVAFLARWASIALYVAVALTWLIPDRRMEAVKRQADSESFSLDVPARRERN